MLNRRLLRVKVMQVLYAHYQNDDTTIQNSEKELYHSISKSLDLYYLYFMLLLELRDYAIGRIEYAKSKKLASVEDKKPNTKFITNKIFSKLAESKDIQKYIDQNGNNWSNYPEVIKGIYQDIVKSQQYKDYLDKKESSFDADRKFVIKLLEKVIAYHEPIYPTFEEQSIYWNDEIEFVLSMVIKSIKSMKEDGSMEVMGEYKDEEDRDYVKKLFRKAALNKEDFRQLIDKYAKNWEIDRVAFMDVVLMQIALAELIEFPNIPVKVTMNEFIEIAKHYSTEKSGTFINGVLDKAIVDLTKDNKIKKTGKGLA
ncbi:transcription antitermination factor NusB [Plebeiibacterium marinum]|uniref:Transcription antitermination factor NusB n=1 Tax=Plebeiibacterium marinum TaxID=2992111 RepID=A0AAE3MGI1_9BACT|nr:transcription antitermination factor NusB [Plebeiobacterium marinum]MCW3806597.1 transcription antitermination factor NusB [Plebeiobacterium marinum]